MIEISVQWFSLSDYHSFPFNIDVFVLMYCFSQMSTYMGLSHVRENSNNNEEFLLL